ncbi:GNAT family N-acetyltransferase [Thalassotalea atypica]|uniref:GNAT family N-acetyltransferase n=1 Tax=Thalassotalea atypica TaxID=2054316 RepID=UPI0025724EAE|nr:GNAT family N-acetyltransferase [Thalassotalea atypica]
MIKSLRLTIRPIEASDCDFLIVLLNEPDFLTHIGDKEVRTTEDAMRYMNEGPLNCQQEHGFSLMTVLLNGELPIGLCGLLKRDELEYPDLGYAFLEKYYRQGYAYEATSAVLKHFQHISPLLATTGETNKASQSLLIKLGFEQLEQTDESKAQQTTTFKLVR